MKKKANSNDEVKEIRRFLANYDDVCREYWNARAKHKYFVDYLFGEILFDDKHGFLGSRPSTKKDLKHVSANLEFTREELKKRIRWHQVELFDVLCCELDEAEEAYLQGDLEHAKQELAQCAAVCIRAMDFVQDEIDKKKGKSK